MCTVFQINPRDLFSFLKSTDLNKIISNQIERSIAWWCCHWTHWKELSLLQIQQKCYIKQTYHTIDETEVGLVDIVVGIGGEPLILERSYFNRRFP